MSDYQTFLKSKVHPDDQFGFTPIILPDFLFGFQRFLVDWAIRKGRAALLEDCGVGKSCQELVVAENVLRKTNKPVLILTPLAVGPQMVKEGEKFGIECKQTRNGKVHKGINVTNYEKLHLYDPSQFSLIVCDESGILKSYEGKLRRRITDALHKVKYRLLATATPSPNDYMELGNSSEALGSMGRGQMLGMFFTNGGESTQQWELKGHARKRFWRWVCSWARACRKPSDLGFDDEGFILPELITRQFTVDSPVKRSGFGFIPAKTLDDQRKERRLTIVERCEKVAELMPENDYALVYCHLNPEGDLLEKLIPGAVQVAGKDRDEEKEERLAAFAAGQIKILVTKPKIAGFGLNFQHCNQITLFPSHSFESYYQTVRRCWRFGQKRKVYVNIVSSIGEGLVISNMQRKEKAADAMFSALVESMSEYQLPKKKQEDSIEMVLPSWLHNGSGK